MTRDELIAEALRRGVKANDLLFSRQDRPELYVLGRDAADPGSVLRRIPVPEAALIGRDDATGAWWIDKRAAK